MKIKITIGEFIVELSDTTNNALRYDYEDIKKLITRVAEDYVNLSKHL